MIFLAALGAVAFACVIWLAVSKKSSLKVRIAALVALGLMILTVIVGIVLIFAVAVAPVGTAIPPDMPPIDADPVEPENRALLLLLAIFLIAMFLLVSIASLREQRKHKADAEKNARRKLGNR